MTSPKTIFITGATGLIGGPAAQILAAQGHIVRALVRPGSERHLPDCGAQIVAGDLADRVALAAGCAGADVVVHLAAVLPGPRRRVKAAQCMEVNLEGTRFLLEAAMEARVKRFVFASTVGVYRRDTGKALREEDARLQQGSAYALSKVQGEDMVRQYCKAGKMQAVVVRPGFVYGERARAWHKPLSRLLRLPVVPLPRGGIYIWDWVHGDDVAAGVGAAAVKEDLQHDVYNLGGGGHVALRDFVEELQGAADRPCRILALPAWGKVWMRPGHGVWMDLARSRAQLGYEPRISLRDGVRRLLVFL